MCVFIQFYESEVKLTANLPFSDVTFIRHHDDQLTLFEVIMSFHFFTLPPDGQLPNCIFRMPFLRSICLPSSGFLYVSHTVFMFTTHTSSSAYLLIVERLF